MKVKILFSLSDNTLATVVFPSLLENFTVTNNLFGQYEILDGEGQCIATANAMVNLPGRLIKYLRDKGNTVELA